MEIASQVSDVGTQTLRTLGQDLKMVSWAEPQKVFLRKQYW